MPPRPKSNLFIASLIIVLTAAFILFFILLDNFGIMGQRGRTYAIMLVSSVGLLSSVKELADRKKLKK